MIARRIEIEDEGATRHRHQRYDVELVKLHPEATVLLRVLELAMEDLRARRDLVSVAHFFLGQDSRLVEICTSLGIDPEEVRRQALREAPCDLKDLLLEPLVRPPGPPKRARCKKGHPITRNRQGVRRCRICETERQRLTRAARRASRTTIPS